MIAFNKPFVTGRETNYIIDAIARQHLSGDGFYTLKCQEWFRNHLPVHASLLTHSCTAALEMAAILMDAQPGDEVIMPSYTFVSTANAFVLQKLVPVFVDIRPDTLNLNEKLIEAAITPKTRAIVPVHYAGVGCEMNQISEIARRHRLMVIEDAAQGMCARYQGKALGTLSDFGTLSFHETKNVHCGEGGALLIRDPEMVERAEILRQKGTNRAKFFRGEVDKYTWVDVGSSFLPSELSAAFLLAQLEEAEKITQERLRIWHKYHDAFAELEEQEYLRRPIISADCEQNAHMYYFLLGDHMERQDLLNHLKEDGVCAIFHYVPLHSSPAGRRYGRASGALPYTDKLSQRIVRLPQWPGMSDAEIDRVIESVHRWIRPSTPLHVSKNRSASVGPATIR